VRPRCVARNRQESPTPSMLRSRSGSDQSLIDSARAAHACLAHGALDLPRRGALRALTLGIRATRAMISPHES
jgi:hypothetical protein